MWPWWDCAVSVPVRYTHKVFLCTDRAGGGGKVPRPAKSSVTLASHFFAMQQSLPALDERSMACQP